ncbi:XRE family transcriptional regulator [Streptomyces sp. ME08-AFT2]|uniref:XRE family transcriptional regulator n=1 Tax=Streptomyces sp. ME08-AFT2 TaxID=3028683 RepID=UPI0029BBD8B8|nr:XRE family transcriptional regulator [Streptomyces sp. ME08-AFT2]MDX3314717.1 XRE family transcriptional regulator [Streptomyces sp. ME08-AFT2]
MNAEETMRRTDLADLVRTRMEELGLGLRSLASACLDPQRPEDGPLWTRGTLENLTKGRVIKAPSEEQLRALAAGLRLPEQVVKRAGGAQFMGITEHWNGDHRTRVLIARIEELDEEGVEEVDELAQIVFRRRERRGSGQG